MNLTNAIFSLRKKSELSQEKFAEILNVSRQAIQKWESGASMPDMHNIITISKMFNISLDALILNDNSRSIEQKFFSRIIEPKYSLMHQWDIYSEFMVEYQQSFDEGKDIAQYEDLFKAADKMPTSALKEKIGDVLFDIVMNASQRTDYKYLEPSSLEEIKKLRRDLPINTPSYGNLDENKLKNKIYGAWVGRICGCLLGKPIECIKTDELIPLLKASNNYPMYRYIKSTDITDEMINTYKFNLRGNCYADTVKYAILDDDTNYTVLSTMLIERFGKNFSPENVLFQWTISQTKYYYCTAERVAFRNYDKGYYPPDSATYKNPYREWIGAQIRGDYFGYINPAKPELAADMAWRDASISHIKNGIYGEMFVAAILSYASVLDDIEQIILGGLSEIPYTSRLYEKIVDVINGYKSGVSEEDCFRQIHKDFNEYDVHGMVHTIPNAMIVVASLLYGKKDYGKSICLAVQTGFDTDCNGATVGSVLGMVIGVDEIPNEWKKPINNELDTSIFGVGKVKISDMVDITLKHIKL